MNPHLADTDPLMPGTDETLIPPHRAAPRSPWVDIGLILTDYPPATHVYEQLLHETELLHGTGHASACFFIHKPPGLRWRLSAMADMPLSELREAAVAAAARVVGPDRVRSAVYEPQEVLFGGSRSMHFVHRTWSADSRLWMRWHAARGGRATSGERWELSFRVLARVYAALGVVGWEDREVWDRVCRDTGRRLTEHAWARPEVVSLARALQERWGDAWGTPARGPGPERDGLRASLVDEFARTGDDLFRAWHRECLSLPRTHHPLSPRQAAAYWTVFHWNRAGFSAGQQALTAEALSVLPLDTTGLDDTGLDGTGLDGTGLDGTGLDGTDQDKPAGP
ncbi:MULTISPECIES: lantibiotic dehydratase C-terminal domain-containing protein [unclassified Streptomyces]|uniref:lantibiotic dehydratase C-terminal domain-containing protein n=1 Tax=unclassified Streptomyces TaxID=2593676 RepID=UPI0006196DF5|nr:MULTISPECIES: lantibiotic dehydratase C-terminal domain-containing protein [unclassified Streptomyces]KKD07600.1 hypothetical protein TN53_13010 [Streptomyces sp. WM6386]KKD15213.1 hypothetical protein TR66_12075 [Streptomyces sp. WM6391]